MNNQSDQALWQRVRSLSGQTLLTASRKAPFKIVSVTDYVCVILVSKSGKERSIPRQDVEKAYMLGPVSTLNTSIIRSRGACEYNPTYVLSILKAVESAS